MTKNLPIQSDPTDVAVTSEATSQFITFYMDKHFFGMPIDIVIEINKNLNITKTPLAPDYVLGVVNLRGRIITAIHLAKRIGLDYTPPEDIAFHNIIMGDQEEPISLLVERIGDVISVPIADIEPPPDLLAGIDIRYVKNVCKLPGKLLVIMNTDALQSVSNN